MCNGSRWIIYTHLGGWSSILEIANVPGFHQFHHERMKSIDESGSCSQKIYELWIWTPQPWGFPLVSISIGLAPVINKSSMTRDGILPKKKKTHPAGGYPHGPPNDAQEMDRMVAQVEVRTQKITPNFGLELSQNL